MIIRVPELTDDARQKRFALSTTALNEAIEGAAGLSEARFRGEIEVDAEIHRRGTDVFLVGKLRVPVVLTCRCCLEEFERHLDRCFKFLIVQAKEGSGPEDDAGLDHYCGEELDLAPLVCEQALLALDEGELCSPDCRGLCAGCGANLNQESCRCPR